MKIAVVMPLASQRGGGELMLTHAVTFANPSDIQWLVIFLEPGPMVDEYRAMGIPCFVVSAGRLRQPLHYLRAVYKIVKIVRREKIVVVCGWMAKGHIYGGVAALIAGIPACWYQLGVDDSHWSMDRLASIVRSKIVITLSQAGLKAQRRISPRTPVCLVYPGADLQRFDSKSLPTTGTTRSKLDLPLDSPIIGIAGRLQRWKGMHTLIAAMPKILKAFPSVICIIVGGEHVLEPQYPAQLTNLAADLGVKGHVRMVGMQKNVNEWLNAMDVVVHASDNEPFGIVVVEAMALGKPLVAGSEGGPAEIISDGVDGLLAPFNDSAALADCVIRFLADAVFAAEVGERARERSRSFSAEAYAAKLVSVFQNLVVHH